MQVTVKDDNFRKRLLDHKDKELEKGFNRRQSSTKFWKMDSGWRNALDVAEQSKCTGVLAGAGHTSRGSSHPAQPQRDREVAPGSPDGKTEDETGTLPMKELGPKFPPHLHAVRCGSSPIPYCLCTGNLRRSCQRIWGEAPD